MLKRGSKKALSTIVSTLLILLLVFVAIGILWVVVRNVINEGTEQVSLGKFTLDLSIENVEISGNHIDVRVKRNPGAGTFTGLSFILDDGDNTEVIERKNLSMGEYAIRTFSLTPDKLSASNVEEIEVAPIFTLESGKEVTGDVKDSYEISKGGTEDVTPECSSPSDCNPSVCQTATCPSGTCVYSSITTCSMVSDGCCPNSCTSDNDADCVECEDNSDCSDMDTSELICSGGNVVMRNTNWTCGSSDTCVSSTNDIVYEDCDDGNSSTADSCSNAQCVHEEIACEGDSTQSCTIENGVGEQTRTCTDGVWSSWGTCTVVSCNDDYEISGNECVLITSCEDGDGNCPSGCDFTNDNDCTAPSWYTGLVSWWTFDSDASDDYGSNDGTASGAVHVASGCHSGGCYDFDGDDDYVDVGTFSVSGDEITLAAWVNFEGSVFPVDPRIISKAHGTDTIDHVFLLGLDDTSSTSAYYRFRFTAGGSVLNYNAGSVSSPSGWHFVVGVYDGSTAEIFVDGSSAGSTSKTGSLQTNSDSVYIGRNPVGNEEGYRPWEGKIDEVMVWDRALSPSEVSELYNY